MNERIVAGASPGSWLVTAASLVRLALRVVLLLSLASLVFAVILGAR